MNFSENIIQAVNSLPRQTAFCVATHAFIGLGGPTIKFLVPENSD